MNEPYEQASCIDGTDPVHCGIAADAPRDQIDLCTTGVGFTSVFWFGMVCGRVDMLSIRGDISEFYKYSAWMRSLHSNRQSVVKIDGFYVICAWIFGKFRKAAGEEAKKK